MIYLRQLQPEGLRRLIEFQTREEMQEYAGGSIWRKNMFAQRILIDEERHRQLIDAHIRKIYSTPEAREALIKHVDLRSNLLREVTDAIAITYNTPPTREIRGATPQQQLEIAAAYAEAATDSVAELWGRYAWLCSVVHVLPRWTADGLEWVTVLPDVADVVWDPQGEAEPSILVYRCDDAGAKLVAVDAERWWWISERWEVVAEEEHQIGMRPWVAFRTEPRGRDYWARARHQGLVDGTLELGRIEAHRAYSRRTQGKPAPWIRVGEDADIPDGQTLNGERPLMVRGDAELGVLDLVVDPAHFTADSHKVYEDAARAEGVQVGAIDRSRGFNQDAHESVVFARDRQIKHLKQAEIGLAVRATRLLASVGAMQQIDEGTIKKTMVVQYADLSFATDPKERVKIAKERWSAGQSDPYSDYMRENPGTTYAEAQIAVERHIEATASFHEFYASRNLPSQAAAGLQSLPQVQGAIGGRTAQENPDGAA